MDTIIKPAGFNCRCRTYETVVLKNGSVLEGYISVQHPGKDIIFFAEKATVYIPVKQVKSVLEYDIEIENTVRPVESLGISSIGLQK